MQRSKVAMVLAGGGVAGAVYEIGALCAIDEALCDLSVNEVDLYVGTSAGALISSCLVNGISPRVLLTALETPLLGIDPLEPHHLFSFNVADTLQRSLRLPSAILDTARRILSERERASFLDVIEMVSVGLPTGLYDNSSLEQYLRHSLTNPGRSNSFHQLPRELLIIATDLDTGERAIFGEAPLIDVPISQAVCASAAIPLFYRPVQIGKRYFIDGGVRGTASLDIAIERGANLIVCINPMVPFDNSHHEPGASLNDEGIQRIGNQVFRAFVHAGLHYHLKQARRRHPEVDIILIEPRRDDPVMGAENTMRYSSRLDIARHGFESVASNLIEHDAYYRMLLARHGIAIDTSRIVGALDRLQHAGNDTRELHAAMADEPIIHAAPAGLAETLAELDRILKRFERVNG